MEQDTSPAPAGQASILDLETIDACFEAIHQVGIKMGRAGQRSPVMEAWARVRSLVDGKQEAAEIASSIPDTHRGLYRKYDVQRSDGSSRPGGKHAKCRYYVLDLSHDPYAGLALTAYAIACEKTHPHLSHDLKRLAVKETL